MTNSPRTARRFFVWAAILSLFLAQVTKVLAYGLLHEHVPLRVLGNVLRFSLTSNPRGLFGLSFGPPIVYFLLPVLGIGLVVYFALRSPDCWLATAYGMVLGGAIGNLVDRLRLGYVIDFIDVGMRGWRWYTFNLADAFVVTGIFVLLGREVFAARRPRPAPSPEPEMEGSDEKSLSGQ